MISDNHLKMLTASGITEEFATARGYETVTDKGRLGALPIHTGETIKIVGPGRRVPGLLIPLLNIDGETASYQYRPDNPRLGEQGRPIKYESMWQQPPILDVPPGLGRRVTDPDETLWITEGSKKADAAAIAGLCCASLSGVWCWMAKNSAGASMTLPEFRDIPWKGPSGRRRVIIAFDGDVARNKSVQIAMYALAQYLGYRGARIEYLWLPDTDEKTGLDDYLAGHTVEDLRALVNPTMPPVTQTRDTTRTDRQHDGEPKPAPEPVQPVSLKKLHERFRYWFGKHYDLDAIDATLAAAAVERLDGDPVWLLIVSGPGATKTETIITLKDLDDKTVVVSTISSLGALLSATSKRDRAKDATGGLLKELEPRGMMIVKDLTSILSLPQQLRGPILAALREVYDGHYMREAGVDGGRKIPWTGHIVIIGAVTTVWDENHAAIAEMGDRFTLLRVDSTKKRHVRGVRAVEITGSETQMREELNRLARGVLAGFDPKSAPTPTKKEKNALVSAANVVTLARTAVTYDYRGSVIDAHAPELPTRFAKQLTQIFRGAVAIGIDRRTALRLAIRCARDSMPPLRLAIIDDLAKSPHSTPTDVRKRLKKPRNTIDRQLQALHILGVVDLDEVETLGAFGKLQTHWHYSLAADIDPAALDPLTVSRKTTTRRYRDIEEETEQGREQGSSTSIPSCFSGNGATSANGSQPGPGDTNTAYRGGLCIDCRTRPHSPGRPRCEQCHTIHIRVMAGYDQ